MTVLSLSVVLPQEVVVEGEKGEETVMDHSECLPYAMTCFCNPFSDSITSSTAVKVAVVMTNNNEYFGHSALYSASLYRCKAMLITEKRELIEWINEDLKVISEKVSQCLSEFV